MNKINNKALNSLLLAALFSAFSGAAASLRAASLEAEDPARTHVLANASPALSARSLPSPAREATPPGHANPPPKDSQPLAELIEQDAQDLIPATPAQRDKDTADTPIAIATAPARPPARTHVTPAAPPHGDLWQRIREGYALPHQSHRTIDQERNWYVRHPSYLDRTTRRARPYLHLIVEALEARGMPLEIALLPIVESAFQPFAYSHGRAAGIWQFIPGTGRHYGLKQNWWYDGRRDIEASTRAALDYLQYLHKTFEGDWLLALAAYNSGSGTVKSAIRYNRGHNRGTDFWSLRLPRETRSYVPKLLALADIVAEPERYQVRLHPVPDAPYLARVDIGSQIDLALAAELADLSIDDIYRYNPGFNRWATDPDGPHHLLLPVEIADSFRDKLGRVPPEQRITWVRHRIREGETLGHIANRYDTTVGVLRKVNGIDGHLIRAGKNLLIPVAARDLDAYKLSLAQRIKATQNSSRRGTRIVHHVRRGDTLWDLSRKYKVSTRQLAKWNAMAPGDYLRPGQKLVIWQTTRGTNVMTAGMAPTLAGTVRRIRYVVRKGDSLSRISQKFNVSVSDLRAWNGLPKGKYLQPGQKLTLYVNVAAQTGSS